MLPKLCLLMNSLVDLGIIMDHRVFSKDSHFVSQTFVHLFIFELVVLLSVTKNDKIFQMSRMIIYLFLNDGKRIGFVSNLYPGVEPSKFRNECFRYQPGSPGRCKTLKVLLRGYKLGTISFARGSVITRGVGVPVPPGSVPKEREPIITLYGFPGSWERERA